jgi:predicted nucleic acid-binding protein
VVGLVVEARENLRLINVLVFAVVLDACALFPASLRDILLRAADAGLYKLQFTDDIMEEVRRNLVLQRNIPAEKAQRLIDVIKTHFPESLITHHHPLIEAMPINTKDRHVLAAAVAGKAQVIVTQNIKDFPESFLAPFEVKAQLPDEFLLQLLYLNPHVVINIIKEQANDLRNPPKTMSDILETLALHAPIFVKEVHKELEDLQ